MNQTTIDRVLSRADQMAVAAMNEHTLAGLAVGIVHRGKLIYARGFGKADAATDRPVTPSTVFRIGSISKTFTAIALMQLWEQGRFQLDDPVNGYLKGYRVEHPDPQAPPVTFRHLLTHTSGVGELRALPDLLRPNRVFNLGTRKGEEVPSLNEYYAPRLTTDVYPGTKWAYGNHAFATLGQLVEDIGGEPFPEYMIRHVFEPLGMTGTDYLLSERDRDRLATGYQMRRGRLAPVDYLEIVVKPAGSVFSSVDDMARYAAALLGGGQNEHGAVLKPETLRMMMSPHYQLDEHLPAIGLAFLLDRYDGHRIAGHDGGWPGFVSSLLAAPDDDLAVVVFTNTTSLGPSRLAAQLMRSLLDLPDPAAKLPKPGILEDPFLWPDLAGSYNPQPGWNTNARIWMGFGGELQVLPRGHYLTLRSLVGPLWRGVTLYRADAADPLVYQFIYEKQPQTVVFKRRADGQIDRLCLGFNAMYKRPRFQSIRFRAYTALSLLASLGFTALARRRKRRA